MTQVFQRSGEDAARAPLAERIASVYADDAPIEVSADVVEKLKICLLDFLACAFIACDLPWSQASVALTTESKGVANIIGTSHKVSPSDAAFANAVAGHGLVQEDMHAAAVSHLGVVVLPLLLALSQRKQVSGKRWIEAAMVGYEVGARIGRVVITPEISRLFRPTGITGPLAGAAAGSRLFGFDLSSATSALALAANTTAGLNEWPSVGGSDMFFHPGFAARNAYAAVVLAEAGSFGTPKSLDGDAGLLMSLLRKQTDVDIELFLVGHAPEIMSVYNKALPLCNFAQTAAQAALQIAMKEQPDLDNIERIEIRVSEAAKNYPGCNFAGPFERILQAKMSIQFGVAIALVQGKVDEDSYRSLNDPAIVNLLGRMGLSADAQFTKAFPEKQGAKVEIQMKNGTRLTRVLDNVEASTPDGIKQRFERVVEEALGKARMLEAVKFIDRLDQVADVGQLPRMLSI